MLVVMSRMFLKLMILCLFLIFLYSASIWVMVVVSSLVGL